MTITQLIRKLERLREKHGTRCRICVTDVFANHPLRHDVAYLPVDTVWFESVLRANEDGGTTHGANDREIYDQCVVLSGGELAMEAGE